MIEGSGKQTRNQSVHLLTSQRPSLWWDRQIAVDEDVARSLNVTKLGSHVHEINCYAVIGPISSDKMHLDLHKLGGNSNSYIAWLDKDMASLISASSSEDPACSDSASLDISAPAETIESAQISGISPKNPLSIQTCKIIMKALLKK